MSSPSDNEKSKHSDEESLSDKESLTDGKKRTKKDRKKKRKSKDLLKSPAKVGELKSSPGTSKTGLNETESSKKLGTRVMVENSDSNSGEKHVGVVGDNIKQLNINEEDKLKDSKQKALLKPTELQANLEASPGISTSQPEPIIESSRPQMVQQLPDNEQDSLINVMNPLDDGMTIPSTSSLEEVRGEVPNNSLNEPGNTVQPQADLRMLPSTSNAYKRKTFAQKADDTLDDVSEIISDFTDIPSDSSVGGQLPAQSGRRPSQETSSDAKAEDLSGSLGSESKILADKTEDTSDPKNEVDENGGNKADDDDRFDESGADEQEIADKTVPPTEKQCHKERSSDEQHGKYDNEERSVLGEEMIKQHGSNGQNKAKQANEEANEHDKQDLDEQDDKGYEHDRLGKENVAYEQDQKEQHKSSDLLQAGSSRDLKIKDASEDNGDEKAEEQDVGQPMEEQDGSVHQAHSDADASEDYPAEPSEEFNVDDPVNMDDESREDDQMDNEDEEPVDEEDVSSEQVGLNNPSGQETSSNSDYRDFGHGRYLGFPLDSPSPDSGIGNTSSALNLDYPPVPDNSESNEASALGSSSAAGLQNLQHWMERGAVAASAHAPPASEAAQSNEAIPGTSNAAEQAAGTSTSFARFGAKNLNIARLETIEDVPMECLEHFDETPTEGSVVEMIPNVQMTCEKRTEDGTNVGQVQLEDKNLNLSTGYTSNELNVNLIQETSSGANQDLNPDVIDEENNSIQGEETAANNEVSSLNPKTSQRLAKDDSEQLSSSSQEQSRESSLADMDDAIESGDSVSREAELQRTPGANANLLQTSAASSISLAKGSGSKPQRIKRRARKSAENNSPFKKRKETLTCGQQARATIASLKKRKPDSDDESSKDDQKLKQ